MRTPWRRAESRLGEQRPRAGLVWCSWVVWRVLITYSVPDLRLSGKVKDNEVCQERENGRARARGTEKATSSRALSSDLDMWLEGDTHSTQARNHSVICAQSQLKPMPARQRAQIQIQRQANTQRRQGPRRSGTGIEIWFYTRCPTHPVVS
ncbi:hypothetical protein EXIGLDRAFT_291361 [Exidia glandulosa HHB12029]|uniref:Uncharacterized protein n=1 Tax=Exidia glandulosa HHB12029 TaxID=1314781 RepID=A0A165DEB2_EXIGL|nr:hypothetical protein EXIGLDRAFT_291361 [Exidia glandulosa HHB12029]